MSMKMQIPPLFNNFHDLADGAFLTATLFRIIAAFLGAPAAVERLRINYE
jgi:hypothetical protein